MYSFAVRKNGLCCIKFTLTHQWWYSCHARPWSTYRVRCLAQGHQVKLETGLYNILSECKVFIMKSRHYIIDLCGTNCKYCYSLSWKTFTFELSTWKVPQIASRTKTRARKWSSNCRSFLTSTQLAKASAKEVWCSSCRNGQKQLPQLQCCAGRGF